LRKLFILLLASFLILPIFSTIVSAADVKTELSKSNDFIEKSMEAIKADNLPKGKALYEQYNKVWIELEDGVKEQSKQAYGDIENKMGMVRFLFAQDPVQKEKVISALEDLQKTNELFISEGDNAGDTKAKGSAATIKDLVVLLEEAKSKIQDGDYASAAKIMDTFSSSWIDVEGVVLTQSKKVYDDAEKDMVSAKAYLTVNPIQGDKAIKVIDRMHGYLSLLAGDTSYGIVDVITIILREGLEALLVVIALLGFLKKSGQENKRSWIYSKYYISYNS